MDFFQLLVKRKIDYSLSRRIFFRSEQMTQEQSKYAIIKTGGKQYRVQEGDVIDVELLGDTQEGTVVEFEALFVSNGSNFKFGAPHLPKSVTGKFLGVVPGPKITTMKYKRSHNQYRHWGHRQKYSRIEITGIAV
jgi:large subunit ribosomal protein L21